MRETVEAFLEDMDSQMDSDETTMYVTFENIADYLDYEFLDEDVDKSIEYFYRTLTEVCDDYGFEWEKTNKTNHMWNAHETKHFDIILTKVN